MNPKPTDPQSFPLQAKLKWVEWAVAIIITVTSVCFHWSFFRHAGALWRDEVGFAWLAGVPHWDDLWRNLFHDHCPILAPALLRVWCASGWGETDIGLRVWGLLVGLFLLASLWCASRTLRRGIPLLPLALVGLNLTVIRYGDTLRAYGLGSALAVLMLAAIWRAAKKTSFLNLMIAALAACLSVQALYQNATFVFGACCAGMMVCARERRWRDLMGILAVGMVAAASLLPYVRPIIHSQEWWMVEKIGFTADASWKHFSIATASPLGVFTLVWIAGCGLALKTLFPLRRIVAPAAPDPAFYAAIALIIGLGTFLVFLKSSGLPTQSWYYICLLAFLAACLDAILPQFQQGPPGTLVIATAVVLLAWPLTKPLIDTRLTNIDLVARRLQSDAAPEDCIIVNPWYCGVSFARYYHGITPWLTLPPLEDYTTHRYDLLKAKLQQEHPIQPVLAKIAATLQSGHRVWVAGDLDRFPDLPSELNPAPNNPWGWFDLPYCSYWSAQVCEMLSTSSAQSESLPPVTTDAVNPHENIPLLVFSGWKPKATAP